MNSPNSETHPRVLVVEDDAVGIEFIKSILKKLGYAIAGVAATAQEAVEVAERETPSVILMDINLRGPEDGIDAARRIHEKSDVPVIFLTAYSDDALMARAGTTEPYAYLIKPARERELRAAIEMSMVRVRMDRRMKRINILLSAIQEVNQFICRETQPDALLQKSCQALQKALGLRAAWTAHPLRPNGELEWSGGTCEFKDFFEQLMRLPEETAANLPCRKAWRDGKTQIFHTALDAGALRPDFEARNIDITISIPILHVDRRLGVLCLHAPAGSALDPEEIRLLEEAASNLGLALSTMEVLSRLAESEARYRNLFENKHTLMLLLDPAKEVIVDANPAAVDFYGWPREIMQGMPLDRLIDLPPKEVQVEIRRAHQGVSTQLSHRHRLADGSIRDMEIHTGPMRVGPRDLLYAIAQDVTLRKRLEDDLRQASKMEAIGRLAGGIAHDFNNILQTILGNVELAMSSSENGNPVDAELKEIYTAGKRAADVTRQLLAFGRRQTLQPKLTLLNTQIESLLLFLRRVIGEHITLEFIPGENLPPVMVDSVQLDQALLNLCANARDAMPKGGTLIIETSFTELDTSFCATRSPLQPGPYVRVQVIDQGLGMPEHILRHAFEPFFTTKDIGKGTGLGLATVFGIMTQHGGWVEAHSVEGQGTTFDLYWPSAPRSSVLPPSSVSPSPLQPQSILIVEDEPGVQLAMRRILASAGYAVTLSSNGRHALERLRAGYRPDLALLDMIMPEMGGMELSRILEAEFPAVPYLLCSAHSIETLTLDIPPENRPTILKKPFTFDQLLYHVRTALSPSTKTPA